MPFLKNFFVLSSIFFKIAEDVAEHIGRISCEANFLIETLLRGVLTPWTSRNSEKRPKTACRAQTVRFSRGSLKRKSIFRTILLIREEILPRFWLYVPKNGDRFGWLEWKNWQKCQKWPVTAKRCVLQRSYWSAKLIFRTFSLLETYFVVIPDSFLLQKVTWT